MSSDVDGLFDRLTLQYFGLVEGSGLRDQDAADVNKQRSTDDEGFGDGKSEEYSTSSPILSDASGKAASNNTTQHDDTDPDAKKRLRLPREILLLILGYLPLRTRVRVATVCRDWHMAVNDSTNWTSFDGTAYRRYLTSRQVERILIKAGSALKYVKLDGIRSLEHVHLYDALQKSNRLRHLSISHSKIDKETTVTSLLSQFHMLTCLRMSSSRYLTDDALIALSRSAPLLEELDVSYCRLITSNVGLKRMIDGCTRLKSLNLAGLLSVDDSIISYIGQKERALERLNISCCSHVTSTGLRNYASHGPNRLEYFNASNCIAIDRTGLRPFIKASRNLVCLELASVDRMTDDVVVMVWQHLHSLRYLDLEECTYIGDGSICKLRDWGPHVNLRVLSLSHVACITSDGLITVMQQCPYLRVLSIDNCHEITGKWLEKVAAGHYSNPQSQYYAALEVIRDAARNDRASMDETTLCSQLESVCEPRTHVLLDGALVIKNVLQSIQVLDCRCLSAASIERAQALAPELEICSYHNYDARRFQKQRFTSSTHKSQVEEEDYEAWQRAKVRHATLVDDMVSAVRQLHLDSDS